MAKPKYQPPEQSRFGQLVDSLFLLVLVVASLFAPVYFGLAGGGKTTIENLRTLCASCNVGRGNRYDD